MIYIDTFSTLVESNHLVEDIADLEGQVAGWINNGGKLSPGDDKFAAIYQQLTQINSNLNQAEFIQLLTSFKQYLQTLPKLELVTAFEADSDFRKQVVLKLKEVIGGSFVVKFTTNRNLIAGCQINFKGKFGDYSLDKIFREHPEKFFGESLKGDA